MHRLGAAHGIPLWPPHNLVSRFGDCQSPSLAQSLNSTWSDPSEKKPIQLLSVGRIEPASLIRETFLDITEFTISQAIDYRELWVRSRSEDIHIVLLHNSLCSFELEEAARLARSRWPKAKILIIRSGELLIDRALSDERLHPPVTPAVLLDRISNLATFFNERGHFGGDC
jgi:hypothetical protein